MEKKTEDAKNVKKTDGKKESAGKKLQKKLTSAKKHSGLIMTEAQIKAADSFCEGYKTFLDNAKTEREAVNTVIEMAEEQGFELFKAGVKYKAGDKVYVNNRGKAVILAVIGTEPVSGGVNLLAAHIDSPRIDLKQNPIYEDSELALFKTHYYGGIKKYQWTSVPLALHGVIITANGKSVTVNIGEDDNDPVFCITDLLPHLADAQMKRTLSLGIKGEELNILIGSRPFKEDDLSEKVKLNILNILNKKYGIIEDDFISAELEAVPAHKARDVGFDRSMVGAYGQDDRVCAYTALMATLGVKTPKRTLVTILADKEETGSDGNTGMKSAYLKYFISDLAKAYDAEGRTVLSASKCLSADVNAAHDPTFPDVLEKRNAAFINYGVVFTKYTGARGKAGTSDASAEFVGYMRKLMNKEKIIWQTGELGKVDLGGGGTVAAYIANLNVDVLDAGVPVLSMHSPFEITAKNDVYMAYKAFAVFAEN